MSNSRWSVDCIVDEVIGSGAMKDVYFSPDKSYVVCFLEREKHFYQSQAELERQKIVKRNCRQ
jgi:hypothetical protein